MADRSADDPAAFVASVKDPFSSKRAREIDRMRVYETYAAWPELARRGFEAKFRLGRSDGKKAYVLGMGGSAAAGDILAGWLWSRHGVEAEVCKGVLPTANMIGTLAIACSASGQTEETISMMRTAVERGATLVSLSCGGRLAAESKMMDIPHIEMPKILAPRYMLPFMVFSCLAVVDAAFGLSSAHEAKNAIREMQRLGKRIGLEVPLQKNPAKWLALRLTNRTPAIYGAKVTRGVGIRFKNEINENSKRHATYDEMPELFHNEIQAWEEPGEKFIPVILRDDAESERDARLAETLMNILSSMGKQPIVVRGEGRSSLAKLMTMVYKLDLASYYIAIGEKRDPFPTPLITRFKKVT
jgi:glucose/mannose-6-phosphate isomerase